MILANVTEITTVERVVALAQQEGNHGPLPSGLRADRFEASIRRNQHLTPKDFVDSLRHQIAFLENQGGKPERTQERRAILAAFEQMWHQVQPSVSPPLVSVDPKLLESNGFLALGLSLPLVTQLVRMDCLSPFPVQQAAIPLMLANRAETGVAVGAPTGSGKTVAFGAPLVNDTNPLISVPQSLVLSHTRELAAQTAGVLQETASFDPRIKVACVYGDRGIQPQLAAVRESHVIVGTPGRLQDIVNALKTGQDKEHPFKTIKNVVLDEADKLLDVGFLPIVKSILRHVSPEAAIGLFSATMYPGLHQHIAKHIPNPAYLQMETEKPKVKVHFYRVQEEHKFSILIRFLKQSKKTLVFCESRDRASALSEALNTKGYPNGLLRGQMGQNRRNLAISQFKNDTTRILVASDVASRGMDVKGVQLVISYDCPKTPEDNIHRNGRAGRAGHWGEAIIFISDYDQESQNRLEEHYRRRLDFEYIPQS